MKIKSLYSDELIFYKKEENYIYLGRLRKCFESSILKKISSNLKLSNSNEIIYIFNKDNLIKFNNIEDKEKIIIGSDQLNKEKIKERIYSNKKKLIIKKNDKLSELEKISLKRVGVNILD